MSDYVFLYRSTNETHREVHGTPERFQQQMVKWRAWFKEMTDQGRLKSIGQPLERTGKVVVGKSKAINDGPYAETKDIVGGFSIVEAQDIDQAMKLAAGCPILDVGGCVEVRPVMRMEI